MYQVVLGALVIDRCVLLAHRSPNKLAYPGVWDLPGGVVEAGESELDALARELGAELGVQIATASVSHLGRVMSRSGQVTLTIMRQSCGGAVRPDERGRSASAVTIGYGASLVVAHRR